MANPDKQRLLTRWELIVLILAVFLLLYIILQQFGIEMMEVTDESRIIEDPHR